METLAPYQDPRAFESQEFEFDHRANASFTRLSQACDIVSSSYIRCGAAGPGRVGRRRTGGWHGLICTAHLYHPGWLAAPPSPGRIERPFPFASAGSRYPTCCLPPPRLSWARQIRCPCRTGPPQRSTTSPW